MKKDVFSTLNKIDVGAYIEKKGGYNYLSWSNAVTELLKVCPDATWVIHEYTDNDGNVRPYMRTESGCYVKITLTVNGIDRTQIMPVWDHRYNTVKEPNGTHVNTSIQRCLAKVISLHGLGLYIYNGEDIPEESKYKDIDKPKGITDNQLILIRELTKDYSASQKLKLDVWLDSNPTSSDASDKIDQLKNKKTSSLQQMKANSAT